MMEKRLKYMLGNTTHLEIIFLLYNNQDKPFLNNITGLTKVLGKSHITIRKVISDLINAGVLEELRMGRSRVARLKENAYSKILFEFIQKIKLLEQLNNE
jgi:DNA-binding transcriptional ArsR family regulator